MSFSLSSGALLRIGAIVGGFIVLAGGYVFLGPGKPSTGATEHHLLRHPHGLQTLGRTVTAQKTAATAPAAKAKTKREAAPATKATRTAVQPKPNPKPKAKPKAARVRLYSTLPGAVAAALQQHPVVVVSVYNPKADDDQIATAEASAGAALAGVGFAGVDVLDQDQIGPITRTLGVVEDPSVLLYIRPGQVIGQLHGFADRETVAQAVQNAAPAVTKPAVRAPVVSAPGPHLVSKVQWVRGADQICSDFQAKKGTIDRSAGRDQFLAWATRAAAAEKAAVRQLVALGLPKDAAARTLAQRWIAFVRTDESLTEQMIAAIRKNDMAHVLDLYGRANANGGRAHEVAVELGLTGCTAGA